MSDDRDDVIVTFSPGPAAERGLTKEGLDAQANVVSNLVEALAETEGDLPAQVRATALLFRLMRVIAELPYLQRCLIIGCLHPGRRPEGNLGPRGI